MSELSKTVRMCLWLPLVLLIGCAKKTPTLFTLLDASKTGISFQNNIHDTDSLNILDYLYFYNGGGVAIGDVNNDGLADIYFSSNTESNRLYLNKGNMQFEDITATAGVAGKGNWKTGVTMADVNGDGMLDIYVSEVGAYKNFAGRNELFINQGKDANGIPRFAESAAAYGLNAEGFNTQAVFFDYDHDGDLDAFIVNHSVHSTDTYVDTSARSKINAASGDKLFRNDHNHFTEVTQAAGIYSSAIGYGLNVVAADINNDGWDDLYVSNDFHENDYYYVNNQNGTFAEQNQKAFGHESRFSMGCDIADMNNDGLPDIITLDMLPADEKVLKSSDGDEPLSIYKYKLTYGYHYQYSRNCLQLNNGNGTFSDVALYAGVAATDWSWSPLVADFDNDGIKDIFISNGILKRPNDLDYLKFISNDYYGTTDRKMSALEALKKMPEGKVSNYIFRGSDSLKFSDETKNWGMDRTSFSNGAACADLDNDGDIDIVTNNINEAAFIWQNNAAAQTTNHYLDIMLRGDSANRFAVGAKIIIKQKTGMQLALQNTTKGFESSSLHTIHFGLAKANSVDTLAVLWPDNSITYLHNIKSNQRIVVEKKSPSSAENISAILPSQSAVFEDVTAGISFPFVHHEDDYDDFNNQALMPHQLSALGPKMAVADINHDGLDDVFICGATLQAGILLVQTKNGAFVSTNEKVFKADSLLEEVDALFFDANKDGYQDLYAVSGGNDDKARPQDLQDRLYINDGRGNFSPKSLPVFAGNKSAVTSSDIDHDGDLDLFVAGRSVPGKYGEIPASWLLINDGNGNFSIDTNANPSLLQAGMISAARFADLDNDGWEELVIAGDFMHITVYKNSHGKFSNITAQLHLQNTTGLWNTIEIADINGDGFKDILCGNLGENSKLHASSSYPLKMYAGDIDENGTYDQLLAVASSGIYYPFAGKQDLEKQMPGLIRKKYLSYAAMAGVGIDEIFGDKLKKAHLFTANTLSSVAIINHGKNMEVLSLPAAAQWSPIFSFCIAGNQQHSILTGGNFYGTIPYEGRYDANAFSCMQAAKNSFSISNTPSNKPVSGEVRDIKKLRTAKGFLYVLARNNDSCILLVQKPGH